MNNYLKQLKKESFFDRSNDFLNLLSASVSESEAIAMLKLQSTSREDLQKAAVVFCYSFLNRDTFSLDALELNLPALKARGFFFSSM